MIAEEFGPNATYVQGLLERFRSNPELVDDSWRSYFGELLADGASPTSLSGNGATSAAVASGDVMKAVLGSRLPCFGKSKTKEAHRY